MTDKVQKIREEVVRVHNLLPVMDGDNISVNYADRICTTLEMYIDSLQEEPVSEEIEVSYEAKINEAHRLGREEGMFLAKTMFKEPISDDLEKASTKYAQDKYMPVQTSQAFKAGAKWQKEKEYTCYEEAFEDGAKWKREQMMAKAIDIEVKVDAGGYPYIPQMELYDYDKDVPLAKKGDKYKVVLIKEE